MVVAREDVLSYSPKRLKDCLKYMESTPHRQGRQVSLPVARRHGVPGQLGLRLAPRSLPHLPRRRPVTEQPEKGVQQPPRVFLRYQEPGPPILYSKRDA